MGTNGILLNGEVVLHLEKGATKPADLKGFLLPNLLVHLDNQRELEKKIAPDSDMIIFLAVDSRTPWKTAVQVMYTAGQAGLNSLLFVVDSQSAPQAQSDENPTSKSLWVGRDVHNPLTLARVNGEATPISIAELGEKTRQLLGAEALGCWVVQGPSPSSFGAFASVAGSLIAVRPQKIFLVDAATAPNGVAQPNETATDSKSPLPLKDGALAVIRIDLPEIGLPGNTPLPECSPGGVFQSGMSPAENVFRERDRAPGN